MKLLLATSVVLFSVHSVAAQLGFSYLTRTDTRDKAGTVVETVAGGVVASNKGDNGEPSELRSGVYGDMDLAKEHLFEYTTERHDIIRAVNAERNATGLPLLCSHFKLINTAQSQATYIAETNTLTVVNEDGFTPSDRGRSALLRSPGVAEVIAAGFAQAADVVAAWLEATEAQAIVLGNYTHIGPAYAVNKTQEYEHYWAADFAYAPDQNCSGLPEDTVVAA